MIVYFLIAGIIVLDQLTKILIQRNFALHESLGVIENVFHITFVPNYGAAFGILKDKTFFFILTSLIVIISFLFYLKYVPKEKKILRYALVLQIGGAVGNLIDRIRLGYVIDFLDFRVWPVFNVADMAIVFGVGLLIYQILLIPERG
ncbi:Lipoprotein signal peptidase [Koleobacter methoxysyntrophicus]|uniref:Lipoprotein signal peptidase n=1 Tax=Koleobacter methoxysyntrophicus TaxID=2751313 RepID=A0A8A0RNF9_9FIRM|nr:Lipoprotein signal peptidase [Koleobacter methoxysyntrophicus]